MRKNQPYNDRSQIRIAELRCGSTEIIDLSIEGPAAHGNVTLDAVLQAAGLIPVTAELVTAEDGYNEDDVIKMIGVGTGDSGQYLGKTESGWTLFDTRNRVRIDLTNPGALVHNLNEQLIRDGEQDMLYGQ